MSLPDLVKIRKELRDKNNTVTAEKFWGKICSHINQEALKGKTETEFWINDDMCSGNPLHINQILIEKINSLGNGYYTAILDKRPYESKSCYFIIIRFNVEKADSQI